MSDTTQTIFRSAKHFFSGTALSRVAGMLRDMSMAYVFGTEASIAAFMLAFRFSHLLRRLFGEGALQSAFIPEFETLRHNNPQRAFAFFRNLKAMLTLFLIVLILVISFSLIGVAHYGSLSQNTGEILFLILLMLPSLLFICLFGLNASLLQCEKCYFTSSIAPVAFNLIWILAVFLVKNQPEQKAIHFLALSVILACLFQWLMTLPKTVAILRSQISITKDVQLFSKDVLHMGKPLLLGIMGIAASQVNNAVDGLFAHLAEAEGPAFLWYAIRIQQLPLALFGVALSGALLPPLTRSVKNNDWKNYHHFLQYAIEKTSLFMIPITGIILICGDTILNFIYGRGDFNSLSVTGTTWCLWAYGIGLIPSALILLLAPACYAQGEYNVPAYTSILAMIVNAILNSWMIYGFGLGASSVALATSISAWMNLILLTRYLSKKNGAIFHEDCLKGLLQVSFATIAASLSVYLFRFFSHDYLLNDLWVGLNPLFNQQFSNQTLAIISQMGIYTLVFGAILLQKRLVIRKERPL